MKQSNTVAQILNAHIVSRDQRECQIWKNTFESIPEKNLSVVNIVLKDLAILVIAEDIPDNVNIINDFFCWIKFFYLSSFILQFIYSLQNEAIKHSGTDFECPYCFKRSESSSDMKKHIRTHTGEKPYSCEYCPKRFSDNSNCRKHIKQCKYLQ